MDEWNSKKVLFLCTGNYYRSRFAENLFNALAVQAGLRWIAASRGLALERGINNIGPMSRSAILALENMGISPGASCTRFPVQAGPADFERATLVIALKQIEHLPLLHERYPDWVAKVQHWHIDDEPGVLPLIEQEVKELVKQLSALA